jgi:hypothetical protein
MVPRCAIDLERNGCFMNYETKELLAIIGIGVMLFLVLFVGWAAPKKPVTTTHEPEKEPTKE